MMRDGDQIRVIGSGGAPALLTVGQPFSAEEITKRLNSREWRREGEDAPESGAGPQPRKEKLSKASDRDGDGPQPRTELLSEPDDEADPGSPQPRTELLSKPGYRPDQAPAASGDSDRPAVAAPKADWVAYVARTQHMSREDAANYTKADLIEMAS